MLFRLLFAVTSMAGLAVWLLVSRGSQDKGCPPAAEDATGRSDD
jgi:hypothetical protein